MPEEAQNSEPQTSENIQPQNEPQYNKQPQQDFADTPYNPQLAVDPAPEVTSTDLDGNDTINHESSPKLASEPTPGAFYSFQQASQSDSQQPIKSLSPTWLKNKKVVIGIVIAAVILLLSGGSAFAYTSWYQNPEKVLADSVINTFTAKTSIYEGVMEVDGDGNNFKIEATTKQNSATGSLNVKVTAALAGENFSVNGDGLIDEKGDLYFKVGGLTGLIAEAKSSAGIAISPSMSDAIDNIVKKIDGVWVRISSDDLKEYSVESSTAKTCINDSIDKFKNDKVAIDEVANTYRNNPFIVIGKDLGQKDGNFRYQVTNDGKAFKTFAEGLKNTTIYKSLHDCDKNFTIDTTDMNIGYETNSSSDGTVELWVDKWSHKITKIVAKSTNDGTKTLATITTKYG